LKPRTTVRCAVYTRKSSEEGLDQQFNSLDAQRQAAESYIASQKGEGWVCLPDRYDDGGYTGGNTERPGLQRLMADIEAGKIDAVIVYKVDRLSRSLLDFARMMSSFESKSVSFVSVTQHFNTTQSMGRLTLNILLSFAQFERELVSERTRDKIAASRRRGMWMGGHPILGYDLDFKGGRLTVNEAEAERIRTIHAIYLKRRSLLDTARELNGRGWTTKRWTTGAGVTRGGAAFDKGNLHKLLTNVLYLGKVRYKDEVHAGQHPAIVEEAVWTRTQALLKANGRNGGTTVRNKHGALLKGLLRCGPCRCAMTHTYTVKSGGRAYRYYACVGGQKRGKGACPSRPLPADQIERLIVERVRLAGRDPEVRAAVLDQLRRGGGTKAVKADVDAALGGFDGIWQRLSPRERERVLRLLVERVEYDAAKGSVRVTFRDGGPKVLLAGGEAA
jgi:site-specific DNA recombinase